MAKTTLTARYRNCLCLLKISVALTFFLATDTYHSFCQPFPVDTIRWTGPASDRINLVFLSDGYQAAELHQFIEDVHQVAEHFFTQSPFDIYQRYFNLIAIRVPSKESGAKKDPSDTHDTYFGTSFNYSGIERLLVATNAFAAQEILIEQFPLFDQAILIVNDQKYGGSGGWLATTSVHESSPEIALHEIGHSFAGLADEYWAGDQFAGEKPNMTQAMTVDKVPWRNWLDFGDVGIYPHEENPLWARPHQNCKMRVLDPEFCPVCKESLVKRIHDLTSPIISFQPESPAIDQTDDSLVFLLKFLEPDPNSLLVQWHIDEVQYDSYDRLELDAAAASEAQQITMTVVDTTHLLRDPEHLNAHTFSLNWEIKSDPTTQSQQISGAPKLLLFPNPATDLLYLEVSGDSDSQPISVSIVDILGRLVYRVSSYTGLYSIPLAKIPRGHYFLKVSDHQTSQSLSFTKQ